MSVSEGIEGKSSKERLTVVPEVRMIIQRHGQTDRTRPNIDDPAEMHERAGKLTPEGIEETRRVARAKAEEILSEGKKVTFFFLNSPSTWYSQGREYPEGRRAEQTALVSAMEIQKVINEKGFSSDAEIWEFDRPQNEALVSSDNAGLSHPDERLAEPDLHYVWGSDNPTGLIERLRQEFGNNWEDKFHEMREDLEQLGREIGAQSSLELGESTIDLFREIDRYCLRFALLFPGRELVFWLDTHGERVRSTFQYGLDAGQDANGYLFKENELLDLKLENGVVNTEFNGKNYSRKLYD